MSFSYNDTPLSIAFIGGGTNSAVGRAHKTAIELDNKFVLKAGCFSQYPDINMDTAAVYRVAEERVYASIDDLITAEHDRVDAVVVLTPTPLHKDNVISCLNAGLPVICEKALALSSAEAQEIDTVLASNNGFLSVTYNYSGYPMLRELREMIASQQLGDIQQVHVEMPQEGFAKRDFSGKPTLPQEWRMEDRVLPMLSLDLGVHVHHLIRFLTQERPLELVAAQNSFGAFGAVVDNSVCLIKYSNNIISNVWYSKSALGYRNGLRVRIFGSKGSAEWYQFEPEYLRVSDGHGKLSILDRSNYEMRAASLERYSRFKPGHPAGFVEAFANLYSDIADALKQYKVGNKVEFGGYVAGIDEAAEGLQMLEAVERSVKESKWVGV